MCSRRVSSSCSTSELTQIGEMQSICSRTFQAPL
jgi:hypothetical protein